MKKIILPLLVLSMAIGMAACASKSEAGTETTGAVETEASTETTGVVETEANTETTDAVETETNTEASGAAEAYTETVINIDNGDHQIPATVCMPNTEGKHPAVVMLHGTGSQRNEAGDGYAHAAPVLAEKYGIATIRIDFMGSGDSTADYTGYTFKSAVADAVAAANYMAGLDSIDGENIGVMGWSQGGKDAMLSAAWHPEIFKAVVTWAGSPDTGRMVTDERYAEAKENGYFVMDFDWREPLHVSLQWCEDAKNTDVLGEFSSFTGPVLAIHGKEDTTVDPEWCNKIVEANSNEASKTFFIDGMDHTFNVFAEPDLKSLYTAVDATGEFFAEMLK